MNDLQSELNLHAAELIAAATCLDKYVLPKNDDEKRLRDMMQSLAAKKKLFNPSVFRPADEDGEEKLYVLSETDESSPALYLVSAQSRVYSPPHDHTTWAIIAPITGGEVNTLFSRKDGLPLEVITTAKIYPGDIIGMNGDDIHDSATFENEATLCLHLYGKPFSAMTERRKFDPQTGAASAYNVKVSKFES